jgi:hypothetical protein
VERDRLEYYFSRASLTRFHDINMLNEKRASPHEQFLFKVAMRKVFTQCPNPKTFEETDVLTPEGKLKPELFMKAMAHIKSSSSPGYPFLYYNKNSDVNELEVYEECNKLIDIWLNSPLIHHHTAVGVQQMKVDAFLSGYSLPAKIFVKGEPTKISKIARLVFGVALPMNVLGRIICGDYVDELHKHWADAAHKIGIDFNTESGLRKFRKFLTVLEDNKEIGEDLVSDDIQGWEYQVRMFMSITFHEAYLSAAKATPFHIRLQKAYMMSELLSMVIDSDGYIHNLPFYIMFSGKFLTHLENSYIRSSLADLDAEHVKINLTSNDLNKLNTSLCVINDVSGDKSKELLLEVMKYVTTNFKIKNMVNGDDCCLLTKVPVEKFFSTRIGFVHTDVKVQNFKEVDFCSQKFITFHYPFIRKIGEENKTLIMTGTKRVPEGVAKCFYNAIAANDEYAAMDSIANLVTHEAYPCFHELFKILRQ